MLFRKNKRSEKGVAAILVAIGLLAFLGFAALAVDTSHFVIVANELKNASDAGALAGARYLYFDQNDNYLNGNVNPNANSIARDTATKHYSEKAIVEVAWTGANDPNVDDVLRGHWSFSSGQFTASNATTAPTLHDKTTLELDQDLNFVNAVKVVTKREQTPVASFFARVFGYESFTRQRESVAYIGFAGTVEPGDLDMPLAICADALLINGEYTCSVGRMIDSGGGSLVDETGGWTSYYQQKEASDPDPCSGGTNASEVAQIVDPPGPVKCDGSNGDPLFYGQNMATMGGEAETVLKKVRNCWEEATLGANGIPYDEPWGLTLPVVTCPGNNVNVCEKLVGIVELNVLWISGEGESSCAYSLDEFGNLVHAPPLNMGSWSCANPNITSQAEWDACWTSFVNHFSLVDHDGNPATCGKKTLYFQPDCTPHTPEGGTGGQNFGILAKIPVLVD